MGAALDKLSTVSSNSALYLQELSGFAVKESIQTKNSRFLRTVECICEEGRVLVKVYARRGEPAELLEKEKRRLEELAGTFALVKDSNLLPFSKVIVNERAAFLVRQYLAHNLFDRLGTRPFLTDLEKRWILFQLLKGLDQCHHWGIAHGDITTENILLTTWNWVYLTDFSPFKPAYLPLEDPSDFTFFFNSSGRTAYLAPERFYSLSDGKHRPDYTPCSELKPSADVFSFGCVAAELFLESERPLFDFSQLLAYRKGEYNVDAVIATISDPWIRELVGRCTKLDPSQRISIADALSEWPDRAFHPLHAYCSGHLTQADPDQKIARLAQDFDELVRVCSSPSEAKPDGWPSDLHNVPGNASSSNVPQPRSVKATRDDHPRAAVLSRPLEPGEALGVLAEAHALMGPVREEEMAEASRALAAEAEASKPVVAVDELDVNERPLGREEEMPDFSRLAVPTSSDSFVKTLEKDSPEDEVQLADLLQQPIAGKASDPYLIIPLAFIFSSIRNVRTPTAKVAALKLLCRFARVLDDDCRLQRIVPFIFAVLPHSEDKPMVRATVIRSLEHVLGLVRVGESQVFQTYVIPGISTFSKDADETVREALASCMASFATSARRLSETVMSVNDGFDGVLYDLRNSFHSMVRDLLEDNSMAVKRRILMSLTPLCLFFGRRLSTETFVPFVLTFLSHPQWQLRVAAYHHLLGVMSIVGSKSLEDITLALISKSFSDQEEFVIDRAILCVVSLVKADMLRKKVVFDLASLAAPLLLHPSRWVRNAALELEEVVWDSLTPADRFVFFCPFIGPFLRNELPAVAESSAISKLLKEPVRRQDLSVALVIAHELFRKGHRVDSAGYSGMMLSRLKQNNVEDVALGRLLLMSSWMQSHAEGNAAKNNAVAGAEPSGVEGEVVVDGLVAEGRAKVVKGSLDQPIVLPQVNVVAIDRDKRNSAHAGGAEDSFYSEDEYRRRFAHISLKQSHSSAALNSSMSLSAALDPHAYDLSKSEPSVGGPGSPMSPHINASGSNLSNSSNNNSNSPMSKSSNAVGAQTADRAQLNVSLDTTQDDLGPLSPGMSSNASAAPMAPGSIGAVLAQGGDTSKFLGGWRPRGTLVAHLHEHSAGISQLAVSDDHRFFVSGSLDGTVKVWDCERLHTVVTNRSRLTCKLQQGKINSVCMIRNTHSVASACDQGTVHIFNIEHQRRLEKSFSKTVYTGVQTVRLIDRQEGAVFDVRHQEIGSGSILMYSTLRGNIHGWDLRMRNASQESFVLKNAPSLGLLTSVEVEQGSNWMVTGTDLGVYTLWDLRFQIPVRSFSHPSQAGVKRMRSVSSYQRNRNCVWSANGDNTVTLWDVEANRGRHVLRINSSKMGVGQYVSPPLKNARAYRSPEGVAASSVPVTRASMERLVTKTSSILASNNNPRDSIAGLKSIQSLSDLSEVTAATANFPREPPSIRSLLPGPDSQYVITGGTDCKIRYWDLNRASDSYTICGLQKEHKPTYTSDAQEDVAITQESISVVDAPASSRSMNAGLAMASPAHRDAVTDLKMVYSASNMLLSGDRTGVIKVWL